MAAMWQLENRTPFAAERTWTRDRDGAEMWLVAVKCTYDIAPDGTTSVADDQPPVVTAPEYMDPAVTGGSSLRYDSDLVRTKTTTDVLVLGHAYSPGGTAVAHVDVAVRVGPIDKRLHVVGDRVWTGGDISWPRPFTRMPLVYERAYGGFDPLTRDTPSPQWSSQNPVGTGFAASMRGVAGQRLPNIEYPTARVRHWNDRPAPAGLGPIGAHWHPRARLAGTYDARWQEERFPLVPLDFDDRYFQCAPADQQAPVFLTGGEPVELLNLTPLGRLEFALPRVHLGFETFFLTGERYVHEKARLHTVILEPDVARVSLVWHTAVRCHPKVYKLERTRIIQKRTVGRASVGRAGAA